MNEVIKYQGQTELIACSPVYTLEEEDSQGIQSVILFSAGSRNNPVPEQRPSPRWGRAAAAERMP